MGREPNETIRDSHAWLTWGDLLFKSMTYDHFLRI